MPSPGEQSTMSDGLVLRGLRVVNTHDGSLARSVAVVLENG